MILEKIIIAVYTFALIMILAYALAQLNLLFNYLTANPAGIPSVIIQSPDYNEM